MRALARLCILSFFCLSGCNEGEPFAVQSSSQAPSSTQADAVQADTLSTQTILATVGDTPITQQQIDTSLALKLYDLEWVKYELRLEALASAISKQRSRSPAEQAVNVMIAPPQPPRLDIEPPTAQPTHGPADAPIKLAVFCSYPSSHCARMTQTYDALLTLYPAQLQFTFFDFPQAYHFNSGNAAVAARCAERGGQFWRYHKGLMANFDQLKSDAIFVRLAQQVDLDTAQFEQCMQEANLAEEVKANMAYANEMGLSKVPVTLVNGLFINGPKSIDTMRYFIDQELTRLGIEPKQVAQPAPQTHALEALPVSALPLRLEGISLGSQSEDAMATIQLLRENRSAVYQSQDEILPGVTLLEIHQNLVVIDHAGITEKLLLTQSMAQFHDAAMPDTPEAPMVSRVDPTDAPQTERPQKKYLVEPDDIPHDLEYTYRGVVDPKGDTPLSRDWIADQLVYRESLKTHFEPAEHELEGVHVMRLTNVSDNEFYQTLGLQERDVILRVNEEWVHTAQNSLFEKLENEPEVSIVLMRKGLPVHIKYSIN